MRDGSTVHLRPVRPTDQQRLLELFGSLDPHSLAFRFFSGGTDLEGAARELARVDYAQRFGLLASRGAEARPVGHGLYVGMGEGRAEVAFAIAPELQGLGLGTILLAHLAEAAAAQGIETFVAEVLPENHRMIELFRESGFPVRVRAAADTIRVELPTAFSADAVARFEDRDRLAAVAAVGAVLEPRSIAVVGASRDRDRVGGAVLANLRSAGFAGALHAVNPAAAEVQGVPAVAAVAELPDPVDLAVLAVPAAEVAATARECAARGVRALVVLSAGFGEIGPDGAARERELLAVCREAGIRLVGPNCLGVLNTDPAHPLDATFAPEAPPAGDVGFVTQSGALGLALIDLAAARGIGVSSFLSVGNRADLTANDVLEFWERDPRTSVALLYIESFSDPRRFARVARRVGRRKPIVAVKSGGSGAGARAAASHTGALLAGSERATTSLFEQAGVIRTETLAELLDVAALLSTQPLPRGPRVGILTNAGGLGIMCADACEAAGLEVPEPDEDTRRGLAAFLPPQAALGNPVDMIATASAADYRRAISTLASWEGIDALIVIFIRPLLTATGAVAAAIQAAVAELPRELPVQAVFLSREDHGALWAATSTPVYLYPEDAARALGKVAGHARWRRRPYAAAASPAAIRPDAAAAVLSEALGEGREWLGPDACERLLAAYGIATPSARLAADPDGAGAAAAALGGQVALKAVGPDILHKTELGAVRLGLAGAAQVREAAAEIDAALASRGLHREAFAVQAMVEEGVELLVGIAPDPVFGPVLVCGAGGTAVELLDDVDLRVLPLDADDPREMLDALAIRPLLDGYRGAPPADLAALEDLIARVGALADAHPELAELDLNPVLATPEGAIAVDCRARVQPSEPVPPWPQTWD